MWNVLRTIQVLNLLDAVQSVLAVTSSLLWMLQAWQPYNDVQTNPGYRVIWVQFSLTVAYMADLAFRVTLEGAVYMQTKWALFDFCTCLPILWLMYMLGFYGDNASQATDGFVSFLVALQVVWQWLILARFLRVFKLLRLTELRSTTFLFNSELTRGVFSVAITILAFIVLGGGLIFLIESAFTYGVSMTYQQALYFMVVTISTVGYGDITPHTIVGQIAIMLIILLAIIVVPLVTSDLVSSISEHYKYGLPYTSRIPHVVAVVAGTMTADDLDSLLFEYYHSHEKIRQHNVVILGSGGEEHRTELLHHVKSTQYWSQVSYIVGSPSSVDDLEKCSVRNAQAVLLLTSASFVDPEQEMAADEQSLLRAISIKHHCPYVPCVISLNSPRSRAHVLWYQLSKFPAIQAVCLNEVKMRLFATAAVCPGLLGVMINLLSSYDGKASMAALFASPDSSSADDAASSHDDSSALQSFTADSVVAHSLSVAAWPLTSARCTDKPLPPDPKSGGQAGGSHSLFYSAALREWQEEYLFGFGQELRTCELPPALDGLTFADVAAALYERLLVVLLAVHRLDPETGKARVILNPGYAARLTVESGDLLCISCQNADHAAAVDSVDWPQQLTRQRWRKQAELEAMDGQARRRLAASFQSNGSAVLPGIPVSSAVARYHLQQSEQQQRQRQEASSRQQQVGSTDATVALSQFVDHSQAVDAVSGSVLEVKQDDNEANDSSDQQQPQQLQLQPKVSQWQPVKQPQSQPDPNAQPKQSEAEDSDPFCGHVVVCGYIDSRIIGFIRRFRCCDARPLVLVLDTAVCYPMPAILHKFITDSFPDVHIVFAAKSFKARHQKERAFLAYTDPCYGHHHYRSSGQQQQSGGASSRAVAASVGSHGGYIESTSVGLMHPALPFDEFSVHDRKVERALHKTDASSQDEGGPEKTEPEALFSQLVDVDAEPEAMDAAALLEHASWYRRAAVHRADSILILANPYSAPPDSTSSDGGGAMNEESSVSSQQQLLTSLYTSSQRSITLVAADEQVKADQHGLLLYAGLQSYLQQCHTSPCPALRQQQQQHESPSVAVELVYHANVRLLKHDADATESYEPHQSEVSGWRWLREFLLQRCCRGRDSVDARRRRVRKELEQKRARHKHALFAQLKGQKASREQQLDEDENGDSDSQEAEEDAERRQAAAAIAHDYADAFYSSDGLMLSAKLLDSLIVQAYAEPLVYDTVTALVGGYQHAVPAEQWSEMQRQEGRGGQQQEASASLRSFRVDVLLLDMPQELVGRSFGFLQLLLIIENGWVALGLYRDRKSVSQQAKKTRQAAASRGSRQQQQQGGQQPQEQKQQQEQRSGQQRVSDRYAGFSEDRDVVRDTGGEDAAEETSGRQLPYSERSRYFVLTNPPPDTILHRRDRIYCVLQRWGQTDTAQRMAPQGGAQPVVRGMADRGRGRQPAPAVPTSYSPKAADAKSIDVPSEETSGDKQ